MKRSTLRALVRSLIAASLPLATVGACNQDVPAGLQDMAVSTDPPVCPQASGVQDCVYTVRYFDGGVSDGSDCRSLCPLTGQLQWCTLHMDNCGSWAECATCVIGRRPESLLAGDAPQASSEAGRYFAHAAHLEAASIEAFEILALELAALGAPHALVVRSQRAASDERRHARLTAALARRFGGEPPPVRVAPAALRELEQLALDNAVEGCVRESFGAILATWQACAATDDLVRRTLKCIAADETRHGELGWAIAAWAEPRLDAEARARIAEARCAAARSLVAASTAVPPAELIAVAGLPVPAQMHFLAQRFASAVTSGKLHS